MNALVYPNREISSCVVSKCSSYDEEVYVRRRPVIIDNHPNSSKNSRS